MFDVVEIIDGLNGHLWPNVKRRQRVPRYKRSLEEKLKERGEWVEPEEEADEEEGVDGDGEKGEGDGNEDGDKEVTENPGKLS